MNDNLIDKYNVPGPRYTSYPTVPYWDKAPPSEAMWRSHVQQAYQSSGQQGISLYVHLPYCESLCTYCGCTTRITVNHQAEEPYINAVLQEWKMYRKMIGEPPLIKKLHLGGGTPTFFSPHHLKKLVQGLLHSGQADLDTTMSLEAHPRNTSEKHLKVLYELGFRRLSLGIQDFDPEVQRAINQKQTYEQVADIVVLARTIGFTSINFDLIYGLPKQTLQTIQLTIDQAIQLQPDRIAFYSYAHVPWMKPAQRSLEPHLPSSEIKRQLYELGKQTLLTYRYHEIGMDHFARASERGELHRNFMGYTTQATKLLIGLGASAISDTWTTFGQNAKMVEAYLQHIEAGHLAVRRGHQLTAEDRLIRQHILNLMCRLHTDWNPHLPETHVLQEAVVRLKEMAEDGLVCLEQGRIFVLPQGKPFLRNVCMALDAKLWEKEPLARLFSTTI